MPRALLVDDKQDVLDFVGETLEHSLQHEFHTACNNEDARKLLQTNDYSYVLLDLRIPASRRGGNARIQNGVSLFHQVLKIKGVGKVPIIIMTSYAAEALNLAGDFQNDGLTFFLAKDLWGTNKTVEDAVKEAMAAVEARRPQPAGASSPAAEDSRTRPAAAEDETAPATPPSANRAARVNPDPAPAPAVPQPARWASIPNEAVELDDFMAKFCEQRSKENRVCRKRALLAAARHGTVKLPSLGVHRKHGQPNRYFVHDLLAGWQGFINNGVDLPPLLGD